MSFEFNEKSDTDARVVVVTDLTSFRNWTDLGLPAAHDVLGCAGLVGIPPCDVQGELTTNTQKQN